MTTVVLTNTQVATGNLGALSTIASPGFVAKTTGSSVNSTGLTITRPAGVINGNCIIVCVSGITTSTNTLTFTPPSGWTAVQGSPNAFNVTSDYTLAGIWYRIANGEPTTYHWTIGGTGTGNCDLNWTSAAYAGVIVGATPDDSDSYTQTVNTSISAAALLTSSPSDMLVAFAVDQDSFSGGLSAPGSMTQRISSGSNFNDGTATQHLRFILCDQTLSAAGNTGTRLFTTGGVTSNMAVYMIALLPSPNNGAITGVVGNIALGSQTPNLQNVPTAVITTAGIGTVSVQTNNFVTVTLAAVIGVMQSGGLVVTTSNVVQIGSVNATSVLNPIFIFIQEQLVGRAASASLGSLITSTSLTLNTALTITQTGVGETSIGEADGSVGTILAATSSIGTLYLWTTTSLVGQIGSGKNAAGYAIQPSLTGLVLSGQIGSLVIPSNRLAAVGAAVGAVGSISLFLSSPILLAGIAGSAQVGSVIDQKIVVPNALTGTATFAASTPQLSPPMSGAIGSGARGSLSFVILSNFIIEQPNGRAVPGIIGSIAQGPSGVPSAVNATNALGSLGLSLSLQVGGSNPLGTRVGAVSSTIVVSLTGAVATLMAGSLTFLSSLTVASPSLFAIGREGFIGSGVISPFVLNFSLGLNATTAIGSLSLVGPQIYAASPPVWLMPSGLIGTVTEGSIVALQLNALDFTFLPLTFSLLNGGLPPGLTLSSTGAITGTPVNTDSQDFYFTVRVTNGIYDVDSYFYITAIARIINPTWQTGLLPAPVNVLDNTDTLITVYQLDGGTGVNLGTSFSFTFPVSNPNQDILLFTAAAIPTITPSAGIYNSVSQPLPPNLVLTPTGISGIITTKVTQAGIYYFQMTLSDPTTVYFSLLINPIPTSNFEAPVIIDWLTPAGLLGELWETYPSYFSVAAEVNNDSVITYVLPTGSNALPPALSLNATTGDIEGLCYFVPHDITFSFVVRAQVGQQFVDRAFQIVVQKRYLSTNVLTVQYLMTGTDRQSWASFYGTTLPSGNLFHSADPNFGIVQTPSLYVIAGLKASTSDQFQMAINDGMLQPVTTIQDYFYTTTVYVGDYNLATARDDQGNALYDVIYREIIDPQANAGGFSSSSAANVIAQPVISLLALSVYPDSLQNQRNELVTEIGIAASNSDIIGPTGSEGMPLWMISPQIATDPTSALGYIPAIVIAYYEAGFGQAVLDGLTVAQTNFLEGHPITIDRYFVSSLLFSQTIFDNNTTTFDGPPVGLVSISFDADVEVTGQYFKFVL